MDPDPTAIDDYIRANRSTYTQEAIRDNLVAAGHDPAAVDGRVRRVGLGTRLEPGASRRPAPVGSSPRPGSSSSCAASSAWQASRMAMSFSGHGSFPIFLWDLRWIGLAVVLLVRWAVPKLGIRGVWAGVLGVALVPIFGALMFGTCVAALRIGRA